MIKPDNHIFQGLQLDADPLKHRSEFLVDAHNIRITSRGEDTELAITNERGTKALTINGDIKGRYMGHSVLNKYLILFTHEDVTESQPLRVSSSTLLEDEGGEEGATNTITSTSEDFDEDALIEKFLLGTEDPNTENIDAPEDNPDNPTTPEEPTDEPTDGGGSAVIPENNTDNGNTDTDSNNDTTGGNTGGSDNTPTTNEEDVDDTSETTNNDYIYRIDLSVESPILELLYQGDLNFSFDYPLETYADYETPLVQKVYWVDNNPNNQCRVINVVKDFLEYGIADNEEDRATNVENIRQLYVKRVTPFDFVPEMQLKEEVTVTRSFDSNSSFPAGTIQYAITYYNKYGQESNIAWLSPLYYTTFKNRAGSPEETINNIFTIKVYYIDTNFDYIRLYSIMHTSKDGTPMAKLVKEVDITNSTANDVITITDNGLIGETLDPTALLYLGGESVNAKTITAKDGTMFLGNISITRPRLEQEVSITTVHKSTTQRNFYCASEDAYSLNTLNNRTSKTFVDPGETGSSTGHITLTSPRTFMYGEHYRIGLQFQYKNGKWTEPLFIKDIEIESHPIYNYRRTSNSETYANILLPIILGWINTSTAKNLISEGYRRVRPLVVYPGTGDKKTICQGIASPTVYNIYDRANNVPYVQSSWFFRLAAHNPNMTTVPFLSYNYGKSDYDTGGFIEFRNQYPIQSGVSRGSEIQGIHYSFYSPEHIVPNITLTEFNTTYKDSNGLYIKGAIDYKLNEQETTIFTNVNQGVAVDDTASFSDLRGIYGVDTHIVTVNSPDIEFDEGLHIPYDIQCNFTAGLYIGDTLGAMQLELASVGISTDYGITKTSTTSTNGNGMYGGLYFQDTEVDEYGDNGEIYSAYKKWGSQYWMVYPWHRSGSLNNDHSREGRTAVIKKKVFSNIRHFTGNCKLPSSEATTYDSYAVLFNSEEMTMEKLNGHIYYGNIDTAFTPPVKYGILHTSHRKLNDEGEAEDIKENNTLNSNLFCFSGDDRRRYLLYSLNESPYEVAYKLSKAVSDDELGDSQGNLATTNEAIRMKYKSAPHIALEFKGDKELLHYVMYEDTDTTDEINLTPTATLVSLQNIIDSTHEYFGGTSDEILQQHKWFIAGESVALSKSGTSIAWEWGDSYFQRYECLKTYPFSSDDVNQVVDILSFMCTTRVNVDGRYDRNRNPANGFNLSPTNFNLRNTVYDQDPNYFTYQILDEDYYKTNTFPTTYAWSLQKNAGSEIDNWTTVTLSSQNNLEGNHGELNALRVYNDKILAFQDTGIANILFNSRVQINTSDGIPIEISNNYKADGHQYVSTSLGCSNRWSICETPDALYFIDTTSQELFNIGSQGLVNLSKAKLCSSWFKSISNKEWLPLKTMTIDDEEVQKQFGTKLQYDALHQDVYIINGYKEAFVYSERLQQFTSFMSYTDMPALFNVENKTFAINNSTVTTVEGVDYINAGVYELFAGEYNNIFGNKVSYDISYISNIEPTADKIFSTINVRADWFNDDVLTENNEFFNKFQAVNEYQDTGEIILDNKYRKVTREKSSLYEQSPKRSNLRKKFRVWRITVPRDKTNKRDRIRNMWTKFTFTHDNDSNSRMEFHDLANMYFLNGGY